MITRRIFISAAAALPWTLRTAGLRAEPQHNRPFEVSHSDAEWRKLLTPANMRCFVKAGPSGPSRARCCMSTGEATSPAPAATSTVLLDDEIRQRHGLAKLLGAVGRRRRHEPRHILGMAAHRGPLQPLRRPSRPCLRRRPEADRPALLHEWRRVDLQARRRLTPGDLDHDPVSCSPISAAF